MFGWELYLLSPICFVPDWVNTYWWARNIQTHGLALIYAEKPLYNYPPLMAYMLWPFAKLFENPDRLLDNLYWSKAIPLAFDFIAAAVAVKWAGDRRRELFCLLLLVANPIYLFDSDTWGQIDSIYCALAFLTLHAMAQDRPVAAALLFTLAFNFKIQALLFAPLFALVLLWKFKNPWPVKRILAAFGAAALLQGVILIPFLLAGQLGRMFDILKNPINYFQRISMNAFNFWHFFYGMDAINTNDTVKVWGRVTAQQAGLALFFGFSLLVLGPVAVRIIKSKCTNQRLAWSEENQLLMCGLIALGFFFFCTQMHERYSQPAILFVAAYAFRTRRYWPLAVMFPAYGINMEFVFHYYVFRENLGPYFLDSRLVAAAFAILIGGLLWRYFKTLPKTDEASIAKSSPNAQAVLQSGDNLSPGQS